MTMAVQNFRPLPRGKNRVFRSAQTDDLAEEFGDNNITLILDLRAPTERNEPKVQIWTRALSWKIVQANEFLAAGATLRHVVCHLNMCDGITHQFRSSRSGGNSESASSFDMMVSLIDQHGLAYLYKLLLRHHDAILLAMKLVALHLQESPQNKILIHCAQGKDRTGIISMLIECVLGCSDEEILNDYTLSEGNVPPVGHLPLSTYVRDSTIFEKSPRSVMSNTLHYLRTEYGSVEGYLNAIRFDATWQHRLQRSVGGFSTHGISARL